MSDKEKKILLIAVIVFLMFFIPECSVRRTGERKQPEPEKIDTDSDGLYDYEEAQKGTDADKKDTDGDGLSDYEEVRTWKTDPVNADTDGDGKSDGEEADEGYDPKSKTAQLDTDMDGLGNADEKKIGTDPDNGDTDGDGMGDKQEVDAGRDPLESGK